MPSCLLKKWSGPCGANAESQIDRIAYCAIKPTGKCNENCTKCTVTRVFIGYTTTSGEKIASSCSSRCQVSVASVQSRCPELTVVDIHTYIHIYKRKMTTHRG